MVGVADTIMGEEEETEKEKLFLKG